jgi:hypothetical protein
LLYVNFSVNVWVLLQYKAEATVKVTYQYEKAQAILEASTILSLGLLAGICVLFKKKFPK